MQVRGENIRKSAVDWIKKAPSFGEEEPLIIQEVNDGDHRYIVKINGKTHKIKSHKEKTRNPEILELVNKEIEYLNSTNSDYVDLVT